MYASDETIWSWPSITAYLKVIGRKNDIIEVAYLDFHHSHHFSSTFSSKKPESKMQVLIFALILSVAYAQDSSDPEIVRNNNMEAKIDKMIPWITSMVAKVANMAVKVDNME